MIVVKKKTIFNIIIFLVILVILCLGYIFYYRLKVLPNVTKDKNSKEDTALIEELSKFYLFSEDETPTIATVSDPELLKGQGFIVQSEVGDKVFFFLKAKKAVLYRPSIKKIIDIIPIKNN